MATLSVLHKVKLKSRIQHRGAHVSSHCRGPFSTVARCGVCAESHMHFSVTSDSELAVKYRFHLPLPKASSCFIPDWLHYKRTSVKHFTVTPWWRRFALKAPALCPGPSERGGSVSLLGGYPSGAEVRADYHCLLVLCQISTVSLAIASRFDHCTWFIKHLLESSSWALFFTDDQVGLKTPLLGVAHLNVTFFPLLFQDGSKNEVTEANALVCDENLVKGLIFEPTHEDLCATKIRPTRGVPSSHADLLLCLFCWVAEPSM